VLRGVRSVGGVARRICRTGRSLLGGGGGGGCFGSYRG